MNNKNGVATLLTVIAIIEFISGAFMTFVAFHNHQEEVGIYVAMATIIAGSMFLGFAEIIKQLQELNNKAISQEQIRRAIKDAKES